MTFREILQRMTTKKKERSEMIDDLDRDIRLKRLVEERQLSANERELLRFQKEEREENIKRALEEYRRQRKEDIDFNHNPLDTPNITTKTQWNIMKEPNLFKPNGNSFLNQKNIFVNERRNK